MINGGTSLVGLLGNPVRHSLSPVMQNAALESMGLNWRYLALPCESESLDQVLKGLRAVGCQGLNVTIPHKQAIAALCEERSPLAQRLGAVNTLIPERAVAGSAPTPTWRALAPSVPTTPGADAMPW